MNKRESAKAMRIMNLMNSFAKAYGELARAWIDAPPEIDEMLQQSFTDSDIGISVSFDEMNIGTWCENFYNLISK